MTLPEITPYSEPRPSMFPLIRDTSPDKVWDLEKVDSFGSKLANKLAPLTPFQKETLIEQQKAALYSTLQMATLEKGTEHLGLNILSSIEQVHSRQNQEKIESKAYIDYRTLLQDGKLTRATIAAVQAEVAAKKKLEDKTKSAVEVRDEMEAIDEASFEDTPGKGFTYLHNLNLYNGAATNNPFKKGDTANYQSFEKNPYFNVLQENFMSPLRVLGKQYWDLGNGTLSAMQSKSLQILGALDPFQDSGTKTFDIQSNYNAMMTDPSLMGSLDDAGMVGFILKRWSDVKNYNKTLNTFTGRNFDHQEITDEILSVNQAKINDDARKAYLSSITDIVEEMNKLSLNDALSGKLDASADKLGGLHAKAVRMIKAFSNSDGINKESQSTLDAQQRELDDIATKSGITGESEGATSTELDKAKAWWDAIGSKVPTAGMLIPFGLMSETASEVADEMALGNWDGKHTSSIAESIKPDKDGFMDKAISGYLRYLKDNEFKGTKGLGLVTESMLAIDDITYGRSVFNELSAAGYITGDGWLTEKITADMSPEDLNINVITSEKERILGILGKSLGGNLNLDKLDQTSTNDKERQGILLTRPNGDSISMEDVFNLIGKGATAEEKYSNAREAYNVLFDMMTSMAKLGPDVTGGDCKLKFQTTKKGTVLVETYPKGSWREWGLDETGTEGSWTKRIDQPITMEFSDLAAATNFFEKIRKNVALLEPILGSFAPLNDNADLKRKSLVYQNGQVSESSLRLLNDNEGGLNATGPITSSSSDFRYYIDTVSNPNYFKTQQWQEVSKFLTKEISFSLGREIFTKTMQNKIQQARHKQQTEDYKEKKEVYEEEEYDKIKQDMKKESAQKAEKNKEENEYQKRQENERKRVEEEDRKRVESQRQKEQAERASRQKKSASDKE